MRTSKLTIFLTGLFFSIASFAQDLNQNLVFKEGDALFRNGQYTKAMRFYQEVLSQNPNFKGAIYQMGECYRMIFDYDQALDYYKQIAKDDPARFPLAAFYYATALKSRGEYDQAVQEFEIFTQNLRNFNQQEDPNYRVYYKQAKVEKEGCQFAINSKTSVKTDHKFQLCGPEINTPFMDFAAFTYDNEQGLCLTSSRSSGKGNFIDYRFGESFADIFQYKKENSKWVANSGKLEKAVNTKWGDGSGSFNKQRTKFYYTNCNETLGEVCHLYLTELKNGSWTDPVELDANINVDKYDSRHPNVTPTGDTLFFSSNRPGGQGDYDIWMSILSKDNKWGPAKNLGDQINTPFIEVSPFYDPRKNALFFSSNGHRGFGGFDIYLAQGNYFFDPEIFNPGAPFNSNKDEIFMFIGETKGYLSSNRDGGIGKLDIYEFDVELQQKIIEEIAVDNSVAGRNSLFTDDYEFDSKNVKAINEIISNFLAAKVIDIELALSEELAKVYNSLSLDDKERINRIIFARVRQLNDRDIQAFRIEDEFFYSNLTSKDKSHMDNLITRYIENNQLGLTVSLGAEEKLFYSALPESERDQASHLIAARVKQASDYQLPMENYNGLSAANQKQVNIIANKFLEDKASLDKLTLNVDQISFMKNLKPEERVLVFASIKEKLLNLSEDPKFEMLEDDRIFFQNLSEELLKALHEMANAFILASTQSLDVRIDPAYTRMIQYYSSNQQLKFNKIIANMITNTVKADVYFAEAKLKEGEKARIDNIQTAEIDPFVKSIGGYVTNESDKLRIKRFLVASGTSWNSSESIFIEPKKEAAVVQTVASPVAAAPTTKAPATSAPTATTPTATKPSATTSTAKAPSASTYGASAQTAASDVAVVSTAATAQNVKPVPNNDEAVVSKLSTDDTTKKPVSTTPSDPVASSPKTSSSSQNSVSPQEQKIESLSSETLNFYSSLSSANRKAVDRIIAFEFLTNSLDIREKTTNREQLLSSLSTKERGYMRLLSKNLKEGSSAPGEMEETRSAVNYYSNLSGLVKDQWNFLILSEVFPKTGDTYSLSAADGAVRASFSNENQKMITQIGTFRISDKDLLSESFELDDQSKVAKSGQTVAEFYNPNFNSVSVRGKLVEPQSGKPIANFPLVISTIQGKAIAKTTTSINGDFDFEDLPRGEYKVQSETHSSSIYVARDLQLEGSKDGRFSYTKLVSIYFDFDSDQIRSEAGVTLDEIAEVYKKYNCYIELKSHTDDVGADDYNMDLSNKRLNRVIDQLKRDGVKLENLEWLAMGDKSPVAPNDTPFGRQFNRRIEILLKSNEPIDYTPARIYLIRPKGTMYSISKNFNLEIAEVQKANGLTGTDLKAYSPIRIPNPKNLSPNLDMLVELNESVAISSNVYTVKQGDTLMSIAESLNIPEELLVEMNNIEPHTLLRPGQQLKIYVRSR